MAMWEPGETVVLIGDVFPASITEVVDGVVVSPPELPDSKVVLFRALITTRGIVVGYQYGGEIHRVELPVPEEETSEATHRGGTVGKYEVVVTADCRCKARMLSTWDMSQAFPGSAYVTEARMDLVRQKATLDPNYGLIPQRGLVRYSRV